MVYTSQISLAVSRVIVPTPSVKRLLSRARFSGICWMSSARIVTLGSVAENAWERRAPYRAGQLATLVKSPSRVRILAPVTCSPS